ncbi:MAG: TraB/GumN family protein [Paracoccus denitrificans]|nr:MAG: TraB/GumN family protein [Paracoccus denitrificans]PZO82682.1 MAG: TraB/GumN family protein [Paracoccus denitrificans]
MRLAGCGLLIGTIFFATSSLAQAACSGRDLIAELPVEKRAEIDQSVAAMPFAAGTMWRATKGPATMTLIGTYHLTDPRLDPLVQAGIDTLTPDVASLMVEAGAAEMAQLQAEMIKDPSIMMDPTGPTLPERLSETEWQRLSAQLEQRGFPPIIASRLRPWYAGLMLGMSQCALNEMKSGTGHGVDQQLMDHAADLSIPVVALEPYDTVLKIASAMSDEDEIAMIKGSLPQIELADDYGETSLAAYLRGQMGLLWLFTRQDYVENAGVAPEEADRQFDLTEKALMTDRNKAWIAPLVAAADDAAKDGKSIVAAFGALHLPGAEGVPQLLQDQGWTVTQIDVPGQGAHAGN